ncbi:hypothetical protein D3875_03945 [Deinococcus cavernae]|uniref:Uncharacterized protein n=1 Tax=Deinococcus cavernae TaxID=2320857 RepID=A0A418VED7_9DEIO|nr:hypothetical protein [Deinococcus cavernae]RJF74438.1 hypothetical protein D3875_03945 [Deinococcus cavernae]
MTVEFALVPRQALEDLRDHLPADVHILLMESAHPTSAVPLGALDVGTPAAEFSAAFLVPLEALAKRCNLFFFAAVAEPGQQDNCLTVCKPARVHQLPPVDGARPVWKNKLAELVRGV